MTKPESKLKITTTRKSRMTLPIAKLIANLQNKRRMIQIPLKELMTSRLLMVRGLMKYWNMRFIALLMRSMKKMKKEFLEMKSRKMTNKRIQKNLKMKKQN
jgi:hypothetical protein